MSQIPTSKHPRPGCRDQRADDGQSAVLTVGLRLGQLNVGIGDSLHLSAAAATGSHRSFRRRLVDVLPFSADEGSALGTWEAASERN